MVVRYFAVLRERRGRDEEQVEVEPGETLGALYDRLFPPTPEGRLPVAFALNREYARAGDLPADGDEVVFVPPIGGG
ncbi:MAG: MoaD/ThiS family protein [Myxococcota bacterium]